MRNALLLSLLLPLFLSGADQPGCDRCFIGKEYMKCSYYVEKEGDLSRQSTCLTYANSLQKGESPGRASWYYIVGGDFAKAVSAGKQAIARGEYFAFEHLAEASLLTGEKEKAKSYFSKLRQKVPQSTLFINKHFMILQKLYPEKFNIKEAKKILQESLPTTD